MDDLRLALRGLWFRRGVSLAVLLVASLVVGAAVTGPVFLRAAGESVLTDSLADALVPGRGVTDIVARTPLSSHPLDVAQQDDRAEVAGLPTVARLSLPPVSALQVDVAAGLSGATPEGVTMLYREGFCDHVRLVRGVCADRRGTVLVSESTAATEGWDVGSALEIGTADVEVTGLYVPLEPAGDYWSGRPTFATYGVGPIGNGDSLLDPLLAPQATVESQSTGLVALATVDRQLDLTRTRLADVGALQTELATYAGTHAYGGVGDTAIPTVLTDALRVVAQLRLPVVVVEVQLLVLCWLVLFLVVANASEARGPEVALAKLRGVPPGATLAFGLLDTLLLVLLAVPVGLALAWAWTVGLARLQMAPGTPVVITPGALLAAAGAGVGAALAAVLAASRTLRRPVVEQWRRATRRTPARSWVVDGVVAAAAIGGLVALLRSGAVDADAPSPYALLAPGLVVLTAALVGSRVLPGLCRATYVPTRRRGQVAPMLAVRQLGRRPSTLRLALLLAVAFGLVTFSVDAWAVTRANAHDRAWTEVGAADVLTVVAPPGADLGAIVDQADPSGAQASAVDAVTSFGRPPSVLLLGVQPDRFANVAFWRPDLGARRLRTLTDRLRTTQADPVVLAGDRLDVDVADISFAAGSAPLLVADVVQPSAIGGVTYVTVGALDRGTRTLSADLPCGFHPCRLAGLHLERQGTGIDPIRGTVTVTGLRVPGSSGSDTVSGDLSEPGSWQPVGGGATGAASGSDGLVLTAQGGAAQEPAWQVADHPTPLPALMTAYVLAARGTSLLGPGGQPLALDPVFVGPALPGGGDRVAVVDRTAARFAAEGGTSRIVTTVWLAPGAAAAVAPRLDAAGVRVLDTTSATEQTVRYERQGPALALLLFLAGAALAALLASGSAVLTLHLGGRRRSYELAAMAVLGVRRRTLLGSLVLEQALLVVFGLLVGTAAGVAAARLALPAIPEFSDAPTAPPLRHDFAVGPVGVSLAVAVVALGLTIVVSSTRLVRAARAEQLREAPA